MLLSPLKPTHANTLLWTRETPQEQVHAFLERVMHTTGFVQGLHPIVEGDICQKPKDLIQFFDQLNAWVSGMNDGAERGGELYLLSDKPRKPCTEEMVSHMQLTSGLWSPECQRVEGRIQYSGPSVDYRDMTFIFSNFGTHFDTCLDDWVPPDALPHIPSELRAKRFKSREAILQVLAKCVNARRFPAVLPNQASPDEREKEFQALDRDCCKLGFPLVLNREGDAAADGELVRRFNELLTARACAATNDRDAKRYGQLFRLDTDTYFALAQNGLNMSIQALGFLITIASDPEFASLFHAMVRFNVKIGESAAYVRDGRLMPDVNWGGDIGYQYAPHQEYLLNGEPPHYFDAMRLGYLMAASMLVVENEFPFPGYEVYRAMMGNPENIPEAIMNLFERVLLPPQ